MPLATPPNAKIEDVFAEHGWGVDRYGVRHETTFFFRDEAKRRPRGWARGLKADGELVPGSFYGEFKRVHLIGAAQAAKAAA